MGNIFLYMFLFVAFSATIFAATLIFFIILFKILKKVEGTVFEWPVKVVLATPFLVCDLIANWTSMFLLFREKPDKVFELVTGRMKRYLKLNNNQDGRYLFAVWLCFELSKADEGHCD